MKLKYLLFSLILSFSCIVKAEWSANGGYRNPFTSSFGINFMHMWTEWAVEAGLGVISLKNRNDDSPGINLGGGVNGKYFFHTGLFRPFAQAGLGLSSGVQGDGAGFGSNGFLLGGGLFVWSSEFHIYFSYNFTNGFTFSQVGIGFPL